MRGKVAPMPSAAGLNSCFQCTRPACAGSSAATRRRSPGWATRRASCSGRAGRCWPTYTSEGARPCSGPDRSASKPSIRSTGCQRWTPSSSRTTLRPFRSDAVRDLLDQRPSGVPFPRDEGLVRGGSARRQRGVVEMDWGEEVVLRDEDIGVGTSGDGPGGQVVANASDGDSPDAVSPTSSSRDARTPLTVVCVPCQHWCKRRR